MQNTSRVLSSTTYIFTQTYTPLSINLADISGLIEPLQQNCFLCSEAHSESEVLHEKSNIASNFICDQQSQITDLHQQSLSDHITF